MRKIKPRKPSVAERNRVAWVEKEHKFIREHSIAYPKPAWTTTHAKWAIVGTLIAAGTLAITIFLEYTPLKIVFLCIFAFIFILFIIDTFIAAIHTSKFYNKLLESGGEIVELWNETLIKRSGTAAIFVVFILLFFCASVGITILANITGDSRITASSSVLIINILNLCNTNYSTTYSYTPYIFMDIDKGMFFGGALFSYDTLCGIRPTGEGSGFELYYEGRKVAEGNMLPDDMKLLQEIIDVRSKYRDLSEDK